MFLCLSPPYPPVAVRVASPIITSSRRYGYLLPSSRNSQLDQCYLFAMICRTFASFLPCASIFTLAFSLCIVCCYPPFPCLPLYLPPFHTPLLAAFLTSFRHCFLNHISSRSRRIISISVVGLSPPLFCPHRSRIVIRYQVVYMFLHLGSGLWYILYQKIVSSFCL